MLCLCTGNQDGQFSGIEETREGEPSNREGCIGLAEGEAADQDPCPTQDIAASANRNSCAEQAIDNSPLTRPPHPTDNDPSPTPEDRADSSSNADIAPFDKTIIGSNAEERAVATAATTSVDILATSDDPHAEPSDDIASSHEAMIATSRDDMSLSGSHGVDAVDTQSHKPIAAAADECITSPTVGATSSPETGAVAGVDDSAGASRTIVDESADAESCLNGASASIPGPFTGHSEVAYGDVSGESGQSGHVVLPAKQVWFVTRSLSVGREKKTFESYFF